MCTCTAACWGVQVDDDPAPCAGSMQCAAAAEAPIPPYQRPDLLDHAVLQFVDCIPDLMVAPCETQSGAAIHSLPPNSEY